MTRSTPSSAAGAIASRGPFRDRGRAPSRPGRRRARRRVAFFVGALLSCAAQQATADDEAARRYFEKAQTAYKLGRYDEAIKDYELAYREMQDSAFLFNIAQAHRMQYKIDHKIGHLRKAVALYRTYLREAKSADQNLVRKLIDELRALIQDVEERTAQESKPGQLVLRGTVGATVKIDGKPSGTLPISADVKAGTHFIVVQKDGYRAWHSAVTVGGGARVEVPVKLEAEPGGGAAAVSTPVYKKWWFWTIIGVVVAGGAAGAGTGVYLATKDSVPELDLR